VKNIEPEWFPEPGELIQPGDPPRPKPDLRDFFKLGRPSEAPGKPLWSGAPPEPVQSAQADPKAPYQPIYSSVLELEEPTGRDYTLRHQRQEFNLYRLSQRLKELDQPKILMCLRFFQEVLKPGESVCLRWPPRRERYRKLNRAWRRSLQAAMRLLKLVTTKTQDEHGRKCLKLFVRHDIWHYIWELVFYMEEPADSTESLLSWDALKKGYRPVQEEKFEWATERAKRLKRERTNEEFDALLANPRTEQRFLQLPVAFKVSAPGLRELSSELGPVFLERLKTALCHDLDRATQEAFARKLAMRSANPPPWEKKPQEPVPAPKEQQLTGKALMQAAKRTIKSAILAQKAKW
jgi:hypothetical protein